MADIMSPEKRSRVMSRIKGKNTTPEVYVVSLLEAAGAQFAQHDRDLPGKPDVVFHDQKVAVFIDGDFWHGWRFPIWQHRLSEGWREKIQANRERDRRNHQRLRRLGWNVMRLWEHQIESDVLACIGRVLVATDLYDDDAWLLVKDKLNSMPPLKRRPRLPKP